MCSSITTTDTGHIERCPSRHRSHAGRSTAAFTDNLHLPARVLVTAADGLTSADGGDVLAELSAASERPMIIFHDSRGATAAALRPQASRSRPTHRGSDNRHGSRERTQPIRSRTCARRDVIGCDPQPEIGICACSIHNARRHWPTDVTPRAWCRRRDRAPS